MPRELEGCKHLLRVEVFAWRCGRLGLRGKVNGLEGPGRVTLQSTVGPSAPTAARVAAGKVNRPPMPPGVRERWFPTAAITQAAGLSSLILLACGRRRTCDKADGSLRQGRR